MLNGRAAYGQLPFAWRLSGCNHALRSSAPLSVRQLSVESSGPIRKKYGSRGVAQAKKIKEETSALFAGGELSEEDQANFIKEMEALFLDAKEEAKKFTPKKYL